MNQLELAIKFAVDAHMSQVDKANKPYILHPIAVMMKGKSETEMIIGILHDVVEDCNITERILYDAGFDEDIVDAVLAISRIPGETFFDYIERCKQNPLARQVKIYDLEHNMSPERQASLPLDVQIGLMKRYTKAMEIVKF